MRKIKIRLEKLKDTRLEDIFENGQCFRWKNLEKDEHTGKNISYIGIYNDRAYVLKELLDKGKKDVINLDICIYLAETIKEVNEEKEKAIIYNYLDIAKDYSVIKKDILENTKKTVGYKEVREAIEYGKGIRILKQDKIETIISFIISANNNIPRIKRSVEYLSKNFGEKIEIDDEIFGINLQEFKENIYTFPKIETLSKLTEEDFKNAGTGFRAKRLVCTIEKLNNGFLEDLEGLSDEELFEKLVLLDGVGPKVANCIMLFAYNRLESFPIDVWVKRVMSEVFFKGIEEEKITNDKIMNIVKNIKNRGIMQQYLFYWRRERGK